MDLCKSFPKTKTISITRTSKGQVVALPMICLALMIVLVVGLFAFELARTAVAREQLRSATEAAALAGAATLAGSTNSSITEAQAEAISAAKDMFRRNQIFADSLTNAEEGTGSPQKGQALLSFQFLDPANNNSPVPAGDPRGKALEVSADYGLSSVAGSLIGLSNSPIALKAKSAGGVGQLDVVLCFDCSLSMRFATRTTVLRRQWNPAEEKINYVVLQTPSQSSQGGMLPQLIGSLNAAMRGATDNSPPGNFPPGTAGQSGFTDIVVNLDENVNFTGFSQDGFNFPNLAALVEASRGNLENDSVFESSGASTALNGVVIPQAGYKAKYFELARKHTHPFAEAVSAAENFFTLMNNNTRCHFGFVAFQTQVGQDPNQTFSKPNVAQNYPQAGTGQFPLPAIPLNPAQGQTNFEPVKNAVNTVVPDGNTNIGGSIERAVRMFDNNNSRPNAKRAIILFTDGAPTVGLPLNQNPVQNCIQAAQLSRSKGIAIYSVGLSLDGAQAQQQSSILNNISNIAGNGGKFFQVNSTAKLNEAFASIARNLTQIEQ